MSKFWKATVVLSVTLNLVSFVAIVLMADAQRDAQWENLSLFHQLSVDQQALRRELNDTNTRFELESR